MYGQIPRWSKYWNQPFITKDTVTAGTGQKYNRNYTVISMKLAANYVVDFKLKLHYMECACSNTLLDCHVPCTECV